MTENADARLARVETALQTLVEEVRLLRDSMQDVGSRLTRLEESTRDAVPQVWRLRERVAELEKETENIKLQLEQLKQDSEKRRATTGNRIWDVAKMVLTPLISGLIGAGLALWWRR